MLLGCADDCPVDSTCSNCDVNSVCKTIVTTSINVCMCNVVDGYVGDGNECSGKFFTCFDIFQTHEIGASNWSLSGTITCVSDNDRHVFKIQ